MTTKPNRRERRHQRRAARLAAETAQVALEPGSSKNLATIPVSLVNFPLLHDAQTFWNGRACTARRVRVIVADAVGAPFYWARHLLGETRAAVEVTQDGETFYIDDDEQPAWERGRFFRSARGVGHGWNKVTAGRGAAGWPHYYLEVERVIAQPEPEQVSLQTSSQLRTVLGVSVDGKLAEHIPSVDGVKTFSLSAKDVIRAYISEPQISANPELHTVKRDLLLRADDLSLWAHAHICDLEKSLTSLQMQLSKATTPRYPTRAAVYLGGHCVEARRNGDSLALEVRPLSVAVLCAKTASPPCQSPIEAASEVTCS